MMKISSLSKQHLYKVIFITLLATVFSILINMVGTLKMKEIPILLIVIMISVIMYTLFYHKRIFLICSSSVITVLILFSIVRKIDVLDKSIQVLKWFFEYEQGTVEYRLKYATVCFILIFFLCFIIAYAICSKDVVKYIASFGTLIVLVVLCIFSITCSRLLVACSILCVLNSLIELRCQQIVEQRDEGKRRNAVIHLLPICIFIVASVIILPVSDQPIKWTGVKKLIHNLQDKGEMLYAQLQLYFEGKDGSYEMQFAGYSDGESNLGGSVEGDTSIVIQVKSNLKEYPGYLIGSVKNRYTGSSWKSKEFKVSGNDKEYSTDFNELILALTRENYEELEENPIIQWSNYEIQYQDIKTVTKFYPLKCFRFNQNDMDTNVDDSGSSLTYNKLKGSGTEYVASFYQLNLDSNFMKDMLRKSDQFSYANYKVDFENGKRITNDLLKKKVVDWYGMGDPYIEMLTKRSEVIRLEYTKLPDSLPQRVYDLAKEITVNDTNTYDRMKSIERYLNQFTYTTQVQKVPKNSDFVDNFLFNERKGYCTYFASAMAVLGRCIGVPTRYVEGFYFDASKSKENTCNVNNTNAHAWVEVYFNGVGWIPFEPTPGYVEKRYVKWKMNDGSEVSYTIPSSSTYQNYIDRYNQQESQTSIMQDIKIHTDRKINLDILWIILFASLIIIIILFLHYTYTKRKYLRTMRLSGNTKHTVMLYRQFIFYLDKIGYPYDNTETLRSFTTRIDQELQLEGTSLFVVNDLYMKIRYGDYEITEEELQVMEHYQNIFRNYLITKYGKIKAKVLELELYYSYKKLYTN